MSWAIRNASRDSPSRKSPAIASFGAKPIEWTKPSKRRPGLAERGEHRLDLGVVGDVAVEDQRRAELGGELGDPLLEALALVAEGELGAFAAAGPGDAVGDRPVREDAGDEEALAGEKSHGKALCARGRCGRFWHAGRRAPAGLDSRVTCRYLRERIQFRSSLESVKWAVLPAHFFWPIHFARHFARFVEPAKAIARMSQHTAIETTVAALGYELVEVERAPGGLLRVTIDHPAAPTASRSASSPSTTASASRASCSTCSRSKGCAYERLEVSSPGLDRPLKSAADFAPLSSASRSR